MKKHSIILLLFCLFGLSARADSYRDSLQTFMVLSKTQQMTALGTMLVSPALDQVFGASLTQIINQFVTTKDHLQMMTDIYEPSFRSYVPEEELATMLHWCRTSKVLAYDPQSLQKAMRTEACRSFAATNIERLKKVPAKVKKGKTIQISSFHVSKSYREAAYLCLDKMEVADTLISILTPAVLQQIGGLTMEEKALQEVQSFTRAFIKEWMIASFSEMFTESDLRYFIQGVDSEPYRHCTEALQYAKQQDKLIAMEFLAALASYVNTYHPHMINTLERTLQQQ